MNVANPYESSLTKSDSHSWRLVDFLVAGLWFLIPIGVFVGQQRLLPVFEEFGVELPTATQYLLSFYAPYLIEIISILVLLAMFLIPYGRARQRFVWLAFILGVLTGVVCSLAILGPLLSLQQSLVAVHYLQLSF